MNFRPIVVLFLSIISNYAMGQGKALHIDSLGVEKTSVNNVQELIIGKMSGVRVSGTDSNPNGDISINIRGVNSMRVNTSPLYIVDGVIINNSQNRNSDAFWQYGTQTYTSSLNPLSFISVEDIESIEIIKDASATALYGSKGANGVVLINTRKSVSSDFYIDWHSAMSVTPNIGHNHYLNFGGAENGLSYNISGFYRNIAGVVDRNTSDHFGARIAMETTANEYIKFGFNSLNSWGKVSNIAGVAYFGESSQTISMRDIAPDGVSPADWNEDFDDNTKDFHSINSLYLTVNLGHFLKWTTTGGLDLQNANRVMWYGNKTHFGKKYNGAAASIASSLFSYNADTRLEYSQYVAQHHQLSASAGVYVNGSRNSFHTINGVNFFTHELRGNGLDLMECDRQSHRYLNNYFNISVKGRIGYDYKEIVGIAGGVSIESTPKYDSANMVYYPFANAYFDIRRAFLQDNSIVSALKLNVGVGASGNEFYTPYDLLGNVIPGDYPKVENDATNYFDGLNRINSKGLDVSAELAMWDGRFNFTAAYYANRIDDMFSIFSFGALNPVSGYWNDADRTLLYKRKSSFVKSGVELDLYGNVLRNRLISLDLRATFSYEHNMIENVDIEDTVGKPVGGNIITNVNAKSYPVCSIWGYQEDADGSWIDRNKDGAINSLDKTILGQTAPTFYGSFGATLKVKDFTLDLMTTGSAGNSIVNLNKLSSSSRNDISQSVVENGSFFRLSRVSCSYDIPLKVKWIEKLLVVVSGNNLLTATKYSGWNPDVDCYSGVMNRGCDYGSYPLYRIFVIGVDITF